MARVRTPEGAERYKQPIGSVITVKPNYSYPEANREGKFVVITHTDGATKATMVATEERARALASRSGVKRATILTPRTLAPPPSPPKPATVSVQTIKAEDVAVGMIIRARDGSRYKVDRVDPPTKDSDGLVTTNIYATSTGTPHTKRDFPYPVGTKVEVVVSDPVTASGGDSWKWQLRDRLGRWIRMGAEVTFNSRGMSYTGRVVDSPKPGVAKVAVGDKTYDVDTNQIVTTINTDPTPSEAAIDEVLRTNKRVRHEYAFGYVPDELANLLDAATAEADEAEAKLPKSMLGKTARERRLKATMKREESEDNARSAWSRASRSQKLSVIAAGQSWKWQLRDRLGKWVEMGSKVSWVAHGKSLTGEVVDSPREGTATVAEDKTKRKVNLPSNRLTVIQGPDGTKVATKKSDLPAPEAPAAPAATSRVRKAIVPAATKDVRATPVATNPEHQSLFNEVWAKIKNFRHPDGTRRKGRVDGTGSAEDPVYVGRDVEKAVELIMEGKHVRMDESRQVALVAEKLKPAIEKRRAEIDAMPDGPEKDDAKKSLAVNLCAVTVPGTNVFCVANKGIPRVHMPQLSGVHKETGEKVNVQPQAEEMLRSMGLLSEEKQVPAWELKASQSELGAEQIAGMLEAYKSGKMSRDVLAAPILVTKDGYIIDGHHRWATLVLLDLEDGGLGDIQMAVKEVDMEVGEALATVNAFADAANIARKKPSGAGEGDVVPEPEILKKAKTRKEVDDYIARVKEQLQPVAASAVLVGDTILQDGTPCRVLSVVAKTSAGRTLLLEDEQGKRLVVLGNAATSVRLEG